MKALGELPEPPGQSQPAFDWLQILIQILLWLGPWARKYVDSLIARMATGSEVFEVKDYRASMDILDARGQRAVYTKRRRIRFLKDGVTGFYDYGWGTGEPFASHRVHPGRVVDRKPVGLRYRSLVVLPEPQNKGDEMTLTVRRLMKKALTSRPGWLEAEITHKTQHLELSASLPKGRRFTSVRLLNRRGPSKVPLRVEPTSGRGERVVARISKPEQGDLYTLEWNW